LIKEAKDLMEAFELPMVIAIASEITEQGKPKYGNEKLREAELYERLKNHHEYCKLYTHWLNAIKKAAHCKIEKEYLKRQWDIWLMEVRM